MIKFNVPYISGNELNYIAEAAKRGKLSGDGYYTNMCCKYFEDKYGFAKCLLTTSCTDALEMIALLCNIEKDDEIIVPSFTFVSSANAFVLRGAKIVFADSLSDSPNIDPDQIDKLITPKTKAVVVVHYAGFACEMDKITSVLKGKNIYLIEDAAQAIDNFYKGKPLGSFGDFAAFSFHETKNIQCGEGGMLVINHLKDIERAEILRDKGTNRSKFFRGEIDKYNWVDVGSSFLLSEMNAAFLFAQLESFDKIQKKRKHIWESYFFNLKILEEKGYAKLPTTNEFSSNNAHMFYLVCKNLEERTNLLNYLISNDVMATFHYQPLHLSQFYLGYNAVVHLPNSEKYADSVIRLPLYFELSDTEILKICRLVLNFFN